MQLYGVACEWIPIISGVPQGSVLGPLLFILYTSEIFELVENKLFSYTDDSTVHTAGIAYTDDCTQLADIRKPADRPTVAASDCRDVYVYLSCNKIKYTTARP